MLAYLILRCTTDRLCFLPVLCFCCKGAVSQPAVALGAACDRDGGICHHGGADTDCVSLSVLYGASVGSSSPTHHFNNSDSSRVFIFRVM